MENWGMELNGGTHHKGICPICDGFNGDCTDGICDKCLDSHPIKCPFCFNFVQPYEFSIKHGKCNECVEYDAQEFTHKIKSKINTMLLAETLNYKSNK